MTRRYPRFCNRNRTLPDPEETKHQVDRSAWQANGDRLDRLVELIASGEAQLSDADDADFQILVTLVGRKRQERLFRFIARMIAFDIRRSREQ